MVLAPLLATSFAVGCSSSENRTRSTGDGGNQPHEDGGAGEAGGDAGPRLADLLAGYEKAWSAADAERLGFLDACFADDGLYTDPIERAAGRDAFSTLIGGFQKQFPGATISLSTGVDSFEDQFRYGWQIALADGTPLMTGEDQGQIGKDGRIQRMTGFFDSTAKVAAPRAVQALLRALNGTTAAGRLTDLESAVVDGVSWTDRWMQGEGRAAVVDHLGTWLTPSQGTTFASSGQVDLHDDQLRLDLTLTTGAATQEGQLFGHLTPEGLMDWVVFFDGPLPAP